MRKRGYDLPYPAVIPKPRSTLRLPAQSDEGAPEGGFRALRLPWRGLRFLLFASQVRFPRFSRWADPRLGRFRVSAYAAKGAFSLKPAGTISEKSRRHRRKFFSKTPSFGHRGTRNTSSRSYSSPGRKFPRPYKNQSFLHFRSNAGQTHEAVYRARTMINRT